MSSGRITALRLTAFKSYTNMTIPLEPLTLLIGHNGSGKSNGLDALEVLSRDQAFVQQLLSGHAPLSGLVQLCLNKIGGGDASILHELYLYHWRTDFPLAKDARLLTLDAQLAALAT